MRLSHVCRPVSLARAATIPMLAVAAAPLNAQAQSTDDAQATVEVRIGGSVRARGEALDGQFRPGAPADDSFLSFRTLIEAEVDIGPLTLGGELDDARGYGNIDSAGNSTSTINVLEPLQAYAALDLDAVTGIGGEASLKAGRYIAEIGSGRLVGRPGFSNSVNSFAGAIFEWKGAGGTGVTALWGKPFDRLPGSAAERHDNVFQLDRVAANRAFFGASITQGALFGGVQAEAYVYRLAEHDTGRSATRDRRLVTFGGRLLRKPAAGTFDFDLEGALQRGEIRASTAPTDRTDLSVRAGFAHAEAGWTFPGAWKPHLSLEFDYATGNGGEPGRYGRFDPLFGSRRGVFGPTSLYGPVSYANVVSPGVRFEAAPSARVDFFVGARLLRLDSATDSFGSTGVRDAAGGSGRQAGTQIEGRVRTWVVPRSVRLEAGGAYLAKGAFLETAPNAPDTGDTRYGYVDLSFFF